MKDCCVHILLLEFQMVAPLEKSNEETLEKVRNSSDLPNQQALSSANEDNLIKSFL